MRSASLILSAVLIGLLAHRATSQSGLSAEAAQRELERLNEANSASFKRYAAILSRDHSDSEEKIAQEQRDADVREYGESLLKLAGRARDVPFRAHCRRRVLSLMTSDLALRDLGRRAFDDLLADQLDAESLRRVAHAASSYHYALGKERVLEDLDTLLSKAKDDEQRALVRSATLRILSQDARRESDQQRARTIFAEVARLKISNDLRNKIDRLRFVIERLQIGHVAPDIVGEDTDGQRFKLSDYRGRVVLLDFWGHW